jgi:hypothetical protein
MPRLCCIVNWRIKGGWVCSKRMACTNGIFYFSNASHSFWREPPILLIGFMYQYLKNYFGKYTT